MNILKVLNLGFTWTYSSHLQQSQQDNANGVKIIVIAMTQPILAENLELDTVFIPSLFYIVCCLGNVAVCSAHLAHNLLSANIVASEKLNMYIASKNGEIRLRDSN